MDPKDPKRAILRAAETVFARHGFRQTAMGLVADQAGLSRQALYHHFASKEALFAALVDDLQDVAFAAAKAAAQKAKGGLAEIATAVLAAYHASLMARIAGSPFAAELAEESSRQCGDTVAAYGRKFSDKLEALIAREVREGRFRLRGGLTAGELAQLIIVASKGVKMAHASEGEAAYARALARMVSLICSGAAAPGAVERNQVQPRTTRRRTR